MIVNQEVNAPQLFFFLISFWMVTDKKRVSRRAICIYIESLQFVWIPSVLYGHYIEADSMSFEEKLFIFLFMMPTYFAFFLHRNWKVSGLAWILTYSAYTAYDSFLLDGKMMKQNINYIILFPFFLMQVI